MLAIFTNEFFWGIVIGAVLTWIGSWLIVWLQERSQRKQRFELIRAFSVDTVENVSQIIRDIETFRQREIGLQNNLVDLLEVEIAVFGKNREHIIYLPNSLRGKLREFTNNVAIKRANVAIFLKEYHKGSDTILQMRAANQEDQVEIYKSAANFSFEKANSAADQLCQLLPDADKLLAELRSATMPKK